MTPKDREVKFDYQGNTDLKFMLDLKLENYYGIAQSWDEAMQKWLPITCIHGGSMYVDENCFKAMVYEKMKPEVLKKLNGKPVCELKEIKNILLAFELYGQGIRAENIQ